MRVEVDPAIFFTYRAKDIQTRFSESPICVEVSEDPKEAFEKLSEKSFDQAPVLERGTIIGWILTKDLANASSVAEVTKYLKQTHLISSEASLNDLLQKLVNQELIFLVGTDGIEGFAVRSDIERHVSRAHLYLLISGIEIVMARIVTRDLKDVDGLLSQMNPESRRYWEFARDKNEDANVVEYMGLRDLGLGISKIQPALNHLGIKAEAWMKYIHELTVIRNWVAHSNTQEMHDHPFFDVVKKMNMTEEFIKKLIRF